MALDFPIRIREPGQVERVRQVDLRAPVAAQPAAVAWLHRHRWALVVGVFAVFVLGFSRAWTGGALVLDGPGTSLYVRLILDHLSADHTVPYWLPDLWAGAPIWAVTPTLPLFLLVPIATALGPAIAVKLGILGLQIFGAAGAFVLARTLWRNMAAAVVAGILFGLQPILISHGALAGSFGTVGVMAAAPWLAWTLRRGLRGDGPGYVALAGLFAGFAVLMQAEYAIGLALLCACLVVVEAGRVGTGRNPASPLQLLGRVVAVVGIGLGSTAYWLLPFAKLGKSFVLSPPELVQGELLNGSGARVGREIGVFFDRAHGLTGAVGYSRDGLLPLFFHLGWACLALSLVSVAALPRKDRDGTLTAILLSSALGIWLATGAVPLASSGPAARGQWLAFGVAGLVAGVLLGTLLRPLRLGRAAPVFLFAAVVFLAVVPYLTPFVTLQKVFPLFSSLRFPRFYAVAPLGLALGAAYPVVLVQEWAELHRARSSPATLAPALAGAVALTIVGLFLVDIWPYRTFYRIRPPASAAAYRQVATSLAGAPGQFRLAPTQIEPTAVDRLLDTGRPLTIGWPHFVAGKQIWRLTAEPFLAPNAYRERAYALSATGFQVAERYTGKGTSTEAVPAIDLAPNPAALPMVRAYNHTVTMASTDVTPELAVGLAPRNVGVVTASTAASPALKATTVVDVRSPHPCAEPSLAGIDPALASQLGVACGLHAWISTLFAGVDLLNIQPGVGAVFRAGADRLQGVSVYLDRVPDRAELALYEVVPGTSTLLGRELARGKAVGADENGLTAFTFDAITGSAGKQYAFILTCPGCAEDRVPRLVAGHSVDQPGDLLDGGTLHLDRAAAFAPVYDPVAADPPSTTTVAPSSSGPGHWRIRVSGTEPALVVVAEAWFPGWEAEVDGHRAPVLQADGAFLGVPVDAGTHVVTLRYRRPAAALAGRAITAGTLLSLAVLALRRRRAAGLPLRPVAAAEAAAARRQRLAPPPPAAAPPRPRIRPRPKYAPPGATLPPDPRPAPPPSPARPARIRPRPKFAPPDAAFPPPAPGRPRPKVAPPAAPAPSPGRRPPPSPVTDDEAEWDLVVRPPADAPRPPAPPADDGDPGPPPAPRRPGTVRWPPEPD
ncbi:MAG TPA: YfhO family protein [Acidimicrobiales bacterium]|nr:YfhO family protein [Acidimicrobiales bacterium]